MSAIRWTRDDMIEAAVEYWGDTDIQAEHCAVIEQEGFLVVLHRPTGRTSQEAGMGGIWNLDGTVVS